MSDFKNIKDFRKSKTSKYPYQDPTFLSFVMLFDFNNKDVSPLLSGMAESYLSKLIDNADSNLKETYEEKLEALKNFKKALATINNHMPWYWQGLTGLDRLLKFNPENAYWGGDEAKLEITTLESLNLPIAGLMHLYRKACFNENTWSYVIPANLRKFRMFVYVTEIRTIKNLSKPTLSGFSLNKFPDNFKPSLGMKNANDGISGQTARPYFMFGLGHCEFNLEGGTAPFSDLSKNPEMATNSIVINYETSEEIQARVLNGIVDTKYNTDKLSPAPDSENVSFDSIGDFALSKINQKIEDLKSGAIDDLKQLGNEKKNELIQKARNLTVNRVQNPANAFKNFVRGIDNATDINQQTRDIGVSVADNIYGGNPGGILSGKPGNNITIGDSLNSAAAGALGNIYK